MAGRPVGHVKDLGGGRWHLFAEGAPDPVTGQRRKRSRRISATSKKDALKQLAAFVREVTEDRPLEAEKVTLDELLDAWLAHIDGDIVEGNTWHGWRDSLRRYVRPALGTTRIDRITPYEIDRLYRQLLDGTGHYPRKISGSTVRKVHTPLRLAFAQAIRWHWLTVNPTHDASPPSEGKHELTPPDTAGAARLLVQAEQDDPDFAALVRLAAATGARRGEIVGLHWSDIDLEGGSVAFGRVVKRVGNDHVVKDYPKNSSSRRRVALGGPTVAALKAMRTRSAARALAAGLPLGPWVFSPDPASRTHAVPNVISLRFRRLVKRTGLVGVRLHDLRHYMATQALGAGVDVRTVAGRGGWSNPTTLLTRYAHWLPARDQAAADVLEGLLEDETGS